jgi:hypothetical protein
MTRFIQMRTLFFKIFKRPVQTLFFPYVLTVVTSLPYKAIAQQPKPNPSSGQASATQAKWIKEKLQQALEQRAKYLLTQNADGYFSKRLEKHQYLIDVDIGLEEKKLKSTLAIIGGTDYEVYIRSIDNWNYEQIRSYLQEAKITLSFGSGVKAEDVTELVTHFKKTLAVGDNSPETVVSRSINLPPSSKEVQIKKELEEREKAEARIKQLEHKLRLSALEKEYELRNKSLPQIQKTAAPSVATPGVKESNTPTAEVTAAPTAAQATPNPQTPASPTEKKNASDSKSDLTQWALAAAILLGPLLASLVMSWGLKNMMKQFSTAAEGLTKSLTGSSNSTSGPSASNKDEEEDESDNSSPTSKTESPSEVGESKNVITTDLIEAVTQIQKEIQSVVTLQPIVAASIFARMLDVGNTETVFAIIQLTGKESIQQICQFMSPIYIRLLQRYFVSDTLKVFSLNEFYHAGQAFRDLMLTSDALMKSEAESKISIILMSSKDREIAEALQSLNERDAAQFLSHVTPERFLKIIRYAETEHRLRWLRELPNVFNQRSTLTVDKIKSLQTLLSDPSQKEFEESKTYFESLLLMGNDEEVETLFLALEQDPKLALAVSGNKATMGDLWEQSHAIMEVLFGSFELEQVAVILYDAPPHVKQNYLNTLPERRRVMLEDSLTGLASNDKHLQKMQESMVAHRRDMLVQLATLAKHGKTELPSHNRLKAKLEELEKQPAPQKLAS